MSVSAPMLAATPSVPPPAHLLKPAHLQSLSTHFHTELDLLDRIVYKNQSQFRLNIFWRKVTEIRRLGRKVRECWEESRSIGLLDTIDQETKGKRESLKRFAVLVEKLHLALPKLHNALNLTIELTHFLPTVVVLLGITSRLWSTSFILYDHLSCLWDRSFGKGTNGKGKGLRKLPEWNHSGSETISRDPTRPGRISEGATERSSTSIVPVSSPSIVTTMTDPLMNSPYQSELGQVIERAPSRPVPPPPVRSSGYAAFHANSDSRSEDEDDTGVQINGDSEAGEKIPRDYFSLPLNSNRDLNTPSDRSTGLDSSPPPSSPSARVPVSNQKLDAEVEADVHVNAKPSAKDQVKRQKILKNDFSVPLVSSPLSRPALLSPPPPPPPPPPAQPSSSLSIQKPSDPSALSLSTKLTKSRKTSEESTPTGSKIKARDSSSTSSTSIPPIKSIKAVTTPATTASAAITAVTRTVPTKRKIDLPIDTPSDASGEKVVKKKKKKKKGDEIDDIFG